MSKVEITKIDGSVETVGGGMFEFMADTRNTLAQVMDRLEALERKVAQHDRDIEQLKRAAGLK